MKDKDRKIVRKGIQRQYFPNDAGNFNMQELRKRKKGIKNIEHQYAERIKSATSPFRMAAAEKNRTVQLRDEMRAINIQFSPNKNSSIRNSVATHSKKNITKLMDA